ncbi:type I polyketide synthase [Methylobrevis pamukkalensis]|uniref:Erythronolide synthase, modules 3 and 4 n=1 Tax=Methylobrevis pamukkalensis TaxID=1439726 RepID=A0A1E3H071_9HYPH|nr:type I polyketide synthase [Methylobrevis pamukkalensis]ODN69738.1 Erythronolide synthase, modules 3 and 4 [Methylobrevis pamukkalensis]
MTLTETDIAIVGYACRLPGASDPDAFWSLLSRGECVISEVQPDRWSKNRFGHPDRGVIGRSYTWAAGQIDDIWGFDPTFFGISPREAEQMDPQQRLLLQVVWEAFEHSGIAPSSIAGREVGVYVGASGMDYSHMLVVDPASGDTQSMTGNTLSIVSNRISYIFDLKGPSFTVDTACSSSMVAMHEALEAIRAGRIDTAVVAGVNVLLSPFAFIGFSRASMLSPTGLCRAFDAAGDGYVRSEGAVAIVLRRADVAEAAGNTLRSLVVGSGINSDGRTAGLSLPSGEQQAALLAQVYERYGLDPDDLAYVEAHGTGTRAGDPIEASALGGILGRRRALPLPIGSVKTNIGHLESASGLAGLLKAQMALEHGVLPPSLHFRNPNPDIDFAGLNIEVVDETRTLPAGDGPRLVGINSFGFGGANAHVVLREAPGTRAMSRPAAVGAAPVVQPPLVLSAQSRDALVAMAARYRDVIAAGDDLAAAKIASAAAWRRDRLDHRLVVVGTGRDQILAGLDDVIAGGRKTPVARTIQRTAPVAFLYAGNGSQWAGMGRAAYQTDTNFRLAFEAVNRRFMRVAGWSLITTLFSEDLEADIERTEVAQPLLFAVQVALTEALQKRGLRPDAVAGHSVGEVAAAWAAGALTLEQAVFLIHVRSTQQEVTRHLGGMAALLVSADQAREALAEPEFAGLELAGDNSPRSVTLSGRYDVIDAFAKYARKKRWALRKLKLDYPFHCALIEPIHHEIIRALSGLMPVAGEKTFVSTVTGDVIDTTELDADYWWRNVRQPVLFNTAVERLAGLGMRVFVEIAPRPVLQNYVGDTLAAVDHAGAILPSFGEDDAIGRDVVGEIVAAALANGAVIDDAAFFGAPVAGEVELPLYPWQNQQYRLNLTVEAHDVFGRDFDHPLLGSQPRAEGGPFIGNIDTSMLPWLMDHKVEESVVFPAAGFVEMALAAARHTFGEGPVEVLDLDILRPMLLDESVLRETRVDVDRDGHVIEISSRRRLSQDEWSLHVRARLARSPAPEAPRLALPDPLPAVSLDHDALYTLTKSFGLNYGPAFRRAVCVRPLGENAVCLELSDAEQAVLGDADYALHPTLLDATFHGLFHLIAETGDGRRDGSFLPVRIGETRVFSFGRTPAAAIIEVTKASVRSIEARFTLVDAEGVTIARLDGVRFKAVQLSRADDPDEFAFRLAFVRRADGDETGSTAPGRNPLAERAAALGLVRDMPEELGEAPLLIDAAARAVAFDVLRGLATADAIDPGARVAEGRLHASALPLVHRLLDAAVEDGAATETPTGWRLETETPYPDLGTLVATLLADHPRRIAEVGALTRVATLLPRRLREGLAAGLDETLPASLADHLETASDAARPLIDAIGTLADDLAAAWPRTRPLRILVTGAGAAEIALRLAARDARITSLAVTDVDSSRLERLRFAIDGAERIDVVAFADLGAAGPFEVILSCGGLGRAGDDGVAAKLRAVLAGGGSIVAAEPAPTFFADLVHGMSAAWWRAGFDRPTGRLRTASAWSQTLEAAGFDGIVSRGLVTPQVDAQLLVARNPTMLPGTALPEAKTDPVLVVAAGRAAATRSLADALCAVTAAAGRAVHLALADVQEDGVATLEPIDGGSDRDRLHGVLSSGTAKDLVLLPDLGATDPLSAVADATMVVHAILNGAMKPPARLWLVAPGGSGANAAARPHDPVAAALWGLGRVLMNEYPDIETRLVDFASAFAPSEAPAGLPR